jgi:hypothetical protein
LPPDAWIAPLMQDRKYHHAIRFAQKVDPERESADQHTPDTISNFRRQAGITSDRRKRRIHTTKELAAKSWAL